jgi:superfamily I DNA/RNA helicase
VSDVDGNVVSRRGAVSVFNGAAPEVEEFATEAEEIDGVARWLRQAIEEGIGAHEIAIFVRSDGQLDRAKAAAEAAKLKATVLDAKLAASQGSISIATMHLSKGLEFRAVVVMACDDEVIPLQERIESITDDADLEEVYETERNLLYVACTRARDSLFISGVKPVSEFLADLKSQSSSESVAS